MKDLFHIVTIGDLHIGKKSITPLEQKEQLERGFIAKLEKIRFLDMIVVVGDLFDRRLSINDPYAEVAIWFIGQILQIANEHKAVVRILRGTYSHDYDQLNAIREMNFIHNDLLKVYDTASEEMIRGNRILFLPEEQVADPNHFYKPFLKVPDETYDYIFGHGLITEMAYFHNDSENMSSRSSLFNTLNLCRITKGQVLFGHIHKHVFYYGRKVAYTGSFMRLGHGEEDDKGFIISSYLQSKGRYYSEFIVNEHTLNFKTLHITNLQIENENPEDIITGIHEFVAKNNVHKLRVKMKFVAKSSNSIKSQIIKKYLQNDKNITLEVKSMSLKAYDEEASTEERGPVEEKPYQRKGLSLSEKIQLWVLSNRQYRIDIDMIKKYIDDN